MYIENVDIVVVLTLRPILINFSLKFKKMNQVSQESYSGSSFAGNVEGSSGLKISS